MHVVALTRWNKALALEKELPALAQTLGLGLYDARLRLVGAPPSLLAHGLTLERARALLGAFRDRGHGAVAADMANAPSARSIQLVRSFELGAAALVVIDELKRTVTLPYAQLIGALRAVEVSSESQSVTTKETKLAIGTAVLSGGMKMSKTVTKVEKSGSSDRQRVAYVFVSDGSGPFLFKEHVLSYEGLGAARGVTAHQSFDVMTTALRKHAPHALHDDRLLVHRRHAENVLVQGTTKERSVSSSNSTANDLAAYLLMLAHLEQQL
jgi:hypothetical protein